MEPENRKLGSTLIVAALSGSNPRFRSRTLTKLRIRRPAPTSKVQANAISETISPLRTHPFPRPPLDPRLPSFSASPTANDRACRIDDRAVKALAAELWTEERRAGLAAGLDNLALQARELPRVREVVLGLATDLDLAWRLFALTLVAEELASDE